MDENGKLTGIRQIVRLKGFLQKWQRVTLSNKANGNGCASDDETGQSPKTPTDVPRGYLAVYVGQELRRFIIPTSYLGDPLFKVLLEKVEEEFGFHHGGGLTIPCEIETFKFLLKCMETHHHRGGGGEDD
ncbi:auxin-induced protein 15A [Andrographis paniculata]|uniref:auxin-induced protein 15A n=1 Tax=Andrographis paniculata TaxID=175694 RepID=UPI0021E72D46|nr:auxin-induced protein 15A [Andrographis paniculata]